MLGANDRFPFGKFKGQFVVNVVEQDPQYCCWLRNEKRKSGQGRVFDAAINAHLDKLIRAAKSKSSLKKHTPFEELAAETAGEIDVATAVAHREFVADEHRVLAYADWGEF